MEAVKFLLDGNVWGGTAERPTVEDGREDKQTIVCMIDSNQNDYGSIEPKDLRW